MPTTTEQVREALTISDTVKYKITIVVTDKGDLPTASLFVVSINDETDSKEDTFARVATIADFTELLPSRSAAITADVTLYRTSSFTLFYDNLETANNAQKSLKEKIDELVADYALFQSEFEAVVAETIVHPQVTESTYNAAVTGYQDALRDTLDAEATRDAAEAAYIAEQAACVTATTNAIKAQEIANDCSTTKGYFDPLDAAFTVSDGDGDVFLIAAQAYYAAKAVTPIPDGADLAFTTAINSFLAALQVSEAVKTTSAVNKIAFATICGKRSTENTTAQAAKTTCDTEQAAARTAFEDAQAAVEVATQAENAALAAVQALKPSFDPTSVVATIAEV